jgi:organic radical activating enzyme
METFYSLQGEGVFAGKPAFFIRLAGCDVGCSWCDVKESWTAEGFPRLETEQLVNLAIESGTEIVVITGGEPLMYNLEDLTSSLQLAGKRVHLETSAAHPISGSWDWVCISPKRFKLPLEGNFASASELKMIVVNKKDLEWAAELAGKVSEDCQLLLQPEWSKSDKVLPMMLDFVKRNPQWRISLQTHKFIDIP